MPYPLSQIDDLSLRNRNLNRKTFLFRACRFLVAFVNGITAQKLSEDGNALAPIRGNEEALPKLDIHVLSWLLNGFALAEIDRNRFQLLAQRSVTRMLLIEKEGRYQKRKVVASMAKLQERP